MKFVTDCQPNVLGKALYDIYSRIKYAQTYISNEFNFKKVFLA